MPCPGIVRVAPWMSHAIKRGDILVGILALTYLGQEHNIAVQCPRPRRGEVKILTAAPRLRRRQLAASLETSTAS